MNEERNLPGCLESIAGVADHVLVVDSGSSDRSVEIAHHWGAEVTFHAWTNYSKQFTWALSEVKNDDGWILRIDADERLSPELRARLRDGLDRYPPEVTGLEVPLRIMFMGRWMRHGGMYPTWLLRVWRSRVGRCEDRWMDEHIVLESGNVARLDGDLIHDNSKDLREWVEKHIGYAAREARDLCAWEQENNGLQSQAAAKRWLKTNVYRKVPLFVRAWAYFVYRYVFRGGMLDGWEGAVYHFLQALWYRFLVDSFLLELRRASARSR